MEDFLSKIGKFALDALFGESAEAAQFYASKEGKVPSDIPLKLKKNLSDVLGKEPKDKKEFNDLVQKLYKQRLEQSKIWGSSEPSLKQTPGEILNEIDQELSQVALSKLNVEKLQDVTPKVLTALGISPEDQKKFNQIIIEQPENKYFKGGISYPLITKPGTEPLGTDVRGIKLSKGELNPQTEKNWGLPGVHRQNWKYDLDKKNEDYYNRAQFLSKVPYRKNDPENAAALLFHELLHNVHTFKAPDYSPGPSQDVVSESSDDSSYEKMMKDLKFLGHFKDPESEYGLHSEIGKIVHPEWYPQPSPSPAPSASPSPTPFDRLKNKVTNK